MKKHLLGIIEDDRGQALTEFVIVMPVVLLFFLVMIQYLVIFWASQLGNYAAYVAARVYAVSASVDGTQEAEKLATDAAALALAPVGRFVPGEILGMGGSLTAGRIGLAALAEGFLVTRYVRFNPDIGGGSVRISTSGAPLQVNVEINYPQPIFIPGLAQLWSFLGGESIHRDLAPLSEGLGGIPALSPPSLPKWFTSLFPNVAARIAGALDSTHFPYANVRSKCALGFEDWGNKKGQPHADYRPRMPSKAAN